MWRKEKVIIGVKRGEMEGDMIRQRKDGQEKEEFGDK